MKKGALEAFAAEFWGIEQTKVVPSLRLDGESLKNWSSVRMYQFFAAIESNFDVRFKDISSIQTFGDLVKNLAPNL